MSSSLKHIGHGRALLANTYEAQLVKGNISPLGGREAASSGDAKEPDVIS